MVRLIGGSLTPSSQTVGTKILIEIPLAGKAERKNGFAARKNGSTNSQFVEPLYYLSEGIPYQKKALIVMSMDKL